MENDVLKVWLDGKIMDYGDAKVPILTHSLQYGSGIFEGIRSYKTEGGTEIFRLDDHIRRFFDTAKIYSMDLGFTKEEIKKAIVDLVKLNSLGNSYIRPFAFYSTDGIGMSTAGKRISVFIAAIAFGAYFGDGLEKGIRCKTSSWRRINSDILPVRAKASGNYINSIISGNEAHNAGFDEAILLSQNGYVAEGPGENIFIVKDKKLVTPGTESDILSGITRDSIIRLAVESGIAVLEKSLHREELYTADEVFFAGTAAEITPIVNIDGIVIGDGKPGLVTKKIRDIYIDVVLGKNKSHEEWLSKV